MRFNTSDPDVTTIVGRLDRGLIDLQPEFQRGEVWPRSKKQKLIDSILRRWHVPPIHLVAKGGGKFDVLDGQQRLSAIRDFVHGVFPVDGRIEPIRPDLEAMHGLRYSQLPEDVRNQFDVFSVRIFELDDYAPDEPHELFFRLNQPMNLTEAEKRNAFIGAPRNQVRALVEFAEESGMNTDRIGFSNARMAYDDVMARFLLTLEQGSLTEKVTAQRITNRYRADQPFDAALMDRAAQAVELIVKAEALDFPMIKPNRATVHTWLCMAGELSKRQAGPEEYEALLSGLLWTELHRSDPEPEAPEQQASALRIFHDRATSRVADALSVVLRDLAAWIIVGNLQESVRGGTIADGAVAALSDISPVSERALAALLQSTGWGETGWL